ncbi:ATP-binding protein [Paenibacillus sp. FSL H8-0048]|uniref:ATP-binding response regulator n=1 Tax=Paenibacillus sp. FSL H8-0048 TaxID=2954508 RepID=UPI0030FCEAB2
MPLLYYVQTAVIGLVITIIITFHMFIRNKQKSELRSIFLGLLLANTVLLLLEMTINIVTGTESAVAGRLLPYIICLFYILNPLPEALWIFYLDAVIRRNEQRGMSRITAVIVCLPLAVNTLLSVASLSGGYLFYVDGEHVYHRGDYFLLMPGMCYIYLLYYLVLMVLKRKHIPPQEFRALLFAAVPAIIAGLLQSMFYGISVVWIALAFSLLIVYINLQNEQVYKELVELDRMKDQLLANTSHELRTPLNGIINITSSLLESGREELDEAQRYNLHTVVSEARRLDSLINDILDAAVMRSGKLKLKQRPIDLHSVAEASLTMIRQLHNSGEIAFLNQIPESLPPVYADEDRLYQIMYNLIGNAAKFTRQGSITTGAVLGQNRIEIWVEDTGSGIAEDRLEDIFKPFYQIDSSETREAGGTGLGLSITRTLIELHGGEIQVSSEQEKGSRFSFTLPLSRLPAEKGNRKQREVRPALLQHHAAFTEAEARNTQTRSILAVEDDPASLAALISILKYDGYSVTAVTDGVSALEALERERHYDLIILDVMMPRMSGYEVLKRLRIRYGMLDMPVLMLTAKARPEDLQAGFAAGANDYLAKPFEALELKSRVKTLVQLKESVSNRIAAELSFLQAQIKPHFLFNSLSTIIALSTKHPQRSKELLYHLSDYLRGSFNFEQSDGFTPLASELSTVRAYVAIEQERFRDRLRVEYEVDERMELMVPVLVIQPLVENAIRHGIMCKMEGGIVRLSIKQERSQAVIRVEDDGVGMSPEQVSGLLKQDGPQTGVGLANIQRRLMIHYGYGLQVESVPDQGTTVTLRIPLADEVQADGAHHVT